MIVKMSEQAPLVYFLGKLVAALAQDKRFRLLQWIEPVLKKSRTRVTHYELNIQKVRLAEPRPYCGNHPGPCPVDGSKKRSLTALDFEDWVAFHNILNDILDAMGIESEVWSSPFGPPIEGTGRSRYWIRKENKRRRRYDWTGDPVGNVEQRRCDLGSPSQFEPQVEAA